VHPVFTLLFIRTALIALILDKILLIKEASTCNYVLVIHTPRLCGEPGFKSERDTQEESVIRCREILNEHDQAKHARLAASEKPEIEIQTPASVDPPHSSNPGLSEGHHPVRFPLAQPQKLLPKLPIVDPDPEAAAASSATPAAPTAATGDTKTTTTTTTTGTGKKRDGKDHAQLLRRALQALLRQTQEDGAPAPAPDANGDDNNANDDAGDGTSALFGSEDVIAVDGEDGQKVFLFVDSLDELDGLDLGAAGDDADGVGLEEDDAGRLTAMRRKIEEQRKLLESLTSTLSKAARRRAPSEDAEKKEDQDDGESALGTHDEL